MSFRRLALLACVVALVPTAAADAAPRLYVSLGDSYASGFVATARDEGANTTAGFAYQLPRYAARRGHRLTLVNFACAGATTTSALRTRGCPARARGVRGQVYRRTSQVTAAARFLRANRGRVGLVTVSLGGNDVFRCAGSRRPFACFDAAVARIEENVGAIAARLRAAAGPRVRIVGTTYPDVLLGRWLRGDRANRALTSLSVVAFRDAINPALRQAYARAGGRFVDVTRATGGYGSFTRERRLAPYGRIPAPVARVCELTAYCAFEDPHARPAGYALIARLVAATLPKR